MEKRNIICIGCPLGCPLEVKIDQDEITVKGNICKRGKTYAEKEVTNPTRIVTSTVPVTGGSVVRVPVKTAGEIPKGMIYECMKEIHKAAVKAPVAIGDVIVKNCAGTGVDIIASRDVAVR